MQHVVPSLHVGPATHSGFFGSSPVPARIGWFQVSRSLSGLVLMFATTTKTPAVTRLLNFLKCYILKLSRLVGNFPSSTTNETLTNKCLGKHCDLLACCVLLKGRIIPCLPNSSGGRTLTNKYLNSDSPAQRYGPSPAPSAWCLHSFAVELL